MWTGVRLDWHSHQIIGSKFLDYIRREAKTRPDRLMEYVALGNGRHVIGLWLNKWRGLIVELVSYHPAYDPPRREHADQVLFNLNNTLRVQALKEISRKTLSDEYSRAEAWSRAEAERDDHREFVLRHHVRDHKRNDPRWFAAI